MRDINRGADSRGPITFYWLCNGGLISVSRHEISEECSNFLRKVTTMACVFEFVAAPGSSASCGAPGLAPRAQTSTTMYCWTETISYYYSHNGVSIFNDWTLICFVTHYFPNGQHKHERQPTRQRSRIILVRQFQSIPSPTYCPKLSKR